MELVDEHRAEVGLVAPRDGRDVQQPLRVAEEVVIVQPVGVLPRALHPLRELSRLTVAPLLDGFQHLVVRERVPLDVAQHLLGVVHGGPIASCSFHSPAQSARLGQFEAFHVQADGPAVREDHLRRKAVEVAHDSLPPRPRMAQHRSQTFLEVRTCPLREGQREHPLILLQRVDLMGGAVRQNLALAAPRRNDQQVILRGGRRSVLLRAEGEPAHCRLSSSRTRTSRATLRNNDEAGTDTPAPKLAQRPNQPSA